MLEFLRLLNAFDSRHLLDLVAERLAILEEQAQLIAQLDPPSPVIFRSNHASNALPLAGTLPKDRDRLLAEIAAARAGEIPLRPDWARSY